MAGHHTPSRPAVSAETPRTGLLPGVASALSFSAADVFGKIVFNDGMDVLSFVTARGLLTTLFFWVLATSCASIAPAH
jgi:hypothetical protein